MMSQLIFLDTEFTNFYNPQLISIGLAASTGEEFYAEVPYLLNSCSEFVQETVIPLLNGTNCCPYDDLHTLIRDWLQVVRSNSELTICYDSEHDRSLFIDVFDGFPPAFLKFRNIGHQNISELLRYDFYRKKNLQEHHALYDALANRYAFREFPRGV